MAYKWGDPNHLANWDDSPSTPLLNLLNEPTLGPCSQESDVCNAYAEQGGARHPAVEELVCHQLGVLVARLRSKKWRLPKIYHLEI